MKEIVIILLLVLSYKEIAAQDGTIRVYGDQPKQSEQSGHKNNVRDDRFRVYTGLTLGLVVMRLSGTMDKANSGTGMVSTGPSNYPMYRYSDTTALAMNLFIPVGFNIPVYRTKKWSTGFKLNAGIGFMAGFKAADGLTSFGLDFPQFVYYRRYSGKVDYSVLAGWKYSYAALPYQVSLLGLEVNLRDRDTQLRFYFSPVPYTYYRELTNGTIEPAVKIYEVGLGYFYNFGK